MIMNKILQNLINTEEVTSLINNMIVGTEDEKEHNKVVEVVRRLVKNNLYMKPKI